MGLNPLIASKNIVEKFLRYIETTFYINDKVYMEKFGEHLQQKDFFAKGPYLDFSDSFELGKSISQLVDEGVLNREFIKLYHDKKDILERSLYKHQELSIRKINEGRNLVVTTGTGSGKTESFLLPIINYLMGQKEKGMLNDGVRALIIYPMNALANDQMKRMRELFVNYPDITFGSYTGETEQKDRDAESKYMALNSGERPLKNERISRDQMKARPPHIMITNYAMLEYLLLRPTDNVFFHGKNSDEWKYIVLDEAHTYTGATGIEVSMLLRRLKSTLATRLGIQFILTSATLGDEKYDKEVCDFASRLCASANFNDESIVRAHRFSAFISSDAKKYSSNIYNEISGLIDIGTTADKIKSLIKSHNSSFESTASKVSELLYDFLVDDHFYYKMRDALKDGPVTIDKISEKIGISEENVVSFVSIARKAEKRNIMLLDARYHMFIRALEGAYVVLGANKELSIIPRDIMYIKGEKFRCYKISICQYCGCIYLEAKIEDSYLVQKRENESKGLNDIYMLVEDTNDETSATDDDTMDLDMDGENGFYLCGKCGRIEKINIIDKSICGCGKEHIVKVMELTPKNNVLNKCAACGLINTQGSVLRGFYLGQEAAASVIGSSLYEEIPAHAIEISETFHEIDDDFFGDIAGFSLEDEFTKNLGKQMLVFSDSRQEAAYFASYFEFTYNNILKRRLLIEALKEIEEYSSTEGIEIGAAAKKLAELLEMHQMVGADSSAKEAWKIILYEISSNDRNSLENTGLILFDYQPELIGRIGEFEADDAIVLQKVLANSFKRDCIFSFPVAGKMLQADREDYLYKGIESTMSKILTREENKKSYRKSWIPISNTNVRFNYIKKILDKDDKDDINKYLEKIWDFVLVPRGGLVAKAPNQYIMDISRYRIKTKFAHDIKWYICDKCGKITANNIRDICPSNRCSGVLRRCDPDEEFQNDHYRILYSELDIFPMRVKEHTAQLSPDTAKKYQEMFVKKKVNVLSSSTTFEMGVDVGELETIFMKNMPPTPANYAQRAGRAGRRKDSAAYSLTFCRLSSHDLTYFNSPLEMIKGKIYPPKFKVENEKIVKRHINAAIISSYWRFNLAAYKDVDIFFESENYMGLHLYIKELPKEVRDYIYEFVPTNLRHKIIDWLHELVSGDSMLAKVYSEYTTELEELSQLREKAIEKAIMGKSVGDYIKNIDDYINTMKHENILAFLSKKNIIPKYGFPVDNVELVTSFDISAIRYSYAKSSRLRLQRDLMIAISEYAPGSEVIADGDIYKSQFIKKPGGKNKTWRLFDFGICPNKQCGHLNIRLHISGDKVDLIGKCEICGEMVHKQNTFIIPEYGFIISPKINKSLTKKPNRTYRGEIHYIGDKKEVIEKENRELKINDYVIKIKSTTDDELAVINTSNFFVCETCGYSRVDEKHKEMELIVDSEEHNNPYGDACKNKKLYRRTLGHIFKTDVAYISLSLYLEKDQALSILYALLEGVSQYLGIERNDISGTLHYNRLKSGVWETIFLLFDTVPGGAGHVRRIGRANEEQFKDMLLKSLTIVKECQCAKDSGGDSACYSCLCNYYNQKHHDIIKRRYAVEFFERILKGK